MKTNPTIWLAYVSYPVTTAAYFERALRKKYKVLTCGPQISSDTLKAWGQSDMKAQVPKHDISTGFQLDLRDALKQVHKDHHPDLFLWVESVFGYLPDNIKGNGFPTACYLIDSHISLNYHLEWAKRFDYIFIAQREYIPEFRKAGIENVFWLPLGCDPEIHFKSTTAKLHEVGFVGTLQGDMQKRRVDLLNKINASVSVSYKRCFLDEMVDFFSASKIVFNNAIKNDLNMRLFETMSIGSFLLTDMANNSGQKEMFRDGEDYVLYDDENIVEKVKYYLAHDTLRENIAKRGQQLAHNAHTYAHRLDELINVSLGIKKDTPSAEMWRERSISNIKNIMPVNIPDIKPNLKSMTNNSRSFVIPVLDMSPASPYNIEKLLSDLQQISGDVIIIFNSVEMADKLKNNPRIDYYAVMKENVGVSRAWNIGLNISQTPVTFIMNSDLHITEETISKMEKYLYELPEAAVVGPQGSFFNFEQAKDIAYFDKNSLNQPLIVDAVSGFLFAVKTELFNSGVLKFDNQYTPCYFEEWDLGLQVKQANLNSYVIPVNGYEHEWSGSIRALRTIKYLNREETAGEILNRNKKLFLNKWNGISLLAENSNILTSIWKDLMLSNADNLNKAHNYHETEKIYKQILEQYPDDISVLSSLGNILYNQNELEEALVYFNRIAEINPEFKIPLNKDLLRSSNYDNKIQPEAEGINVKEDEYYENPRPDIQQLVNKNSKTILDVGCGSGKMAYELKTNLKAEVWGIEFNNKAASVAAKTLNQVISGKVEDAIYKLPDNYFDTIVFADVLEHLIDPTSVLTQIKKKLTGTGEIIASIPNVRFWNLIINLLEGNWEYQEAGILDNTHLRFFTRSSILKMFEIAGYKIETLIALVVPDISVPDEILAALQSAGINVSTLKEDGKHFQYIVKAKTIN